MYSYKKQVYFLYFQNIVRIKKIYYILLILFIKLMSILNIQKWQKTLFFFLKKITRTIGFFYVTALCEFSYSF